MVPKLRQRDLKLLHSCVSEDTQPRANGGFHSALLLSLHFYHMLESSFSRAPSFYRFFLECVRGWFHGCVNPLARSKVAFFKCMTCQQESGLRSHAANMH